MADKTDKTDKAVRSTNWAVTVFNLEEIERLKDVTKWKSGVMSVRGGMEQTKDGKPHYQCHIVLSQQQRMSWFKNWLPTAHLEASRNVVASMNYAMKSDTAIGEKTVITNPSKYYNAHEILTLIGASIPAEVLERTPDKKEWFKASINILLRKDVTLAGQLMNPSLRSFFCDTAYVWIDKAKEQEPPANVIVDEAEAEDEGGL